MTGFNKLVSVVCLLFVVNVSKAQVIKWVEHEWQADIKVYLTDYKWSSDLVVYHTPYKHEAKQNKGWWYWGDGGNMIMPRGEYDYSSDKLNVYVVAFPFQADYKVYITENKWDVRVTDKYVNEVTQ